MNNNTFCPSVSIIIPVYKAEDYISNCIKSVQNQTVNNWELILVDDGSPDRSGTICDQFASGDTRIKVIHQQNSGVSTARNAGIAVARGKYVSFIDSDDYVLPTYLSDMLEYEADVVVTGYINKYTYGGKPDFVRPISGDRFYSITEGSIGQGFADVEMDFRWAGPAAKLYLRDIIVDHNISFNNTLDYGEDHLFNMEFGKHVKSISFLNRHNYVYMHREGESLTNRRVPSETMFAYITRLYNIRQCYLKTVCEGMTQYESFAKQELCFYYWQTVYSLIHEKKTTQQVIECIRCMQKQVPQEVIYNFSYKLPLTYKLERGIFKIFPLNIATFFLKKITLKKYK